MPKGIWIRNEVVQRGRTSQSPRVGLYKRICGVLHSGKNNPHIKVVESIQYVQKNDRKCMKNAIKHSLQWQIQDFLSINQPGRSSEVERNPKTSISFFFLAGEGWQMGFESIDQPGWSSEVECNPKMSISFFGLERGGGWGSSPSRRQQYRSAP